MRPQALHLTVVQPLGEDDAAHSPRAAVGLDPALAVGDAEIALLAPAGAPAVLADPEAAAVVVADDRDAVAAGEVAGHVAVDAAAVREEVLVHKEARGDRAVRRDPVLHRAGRGELLH